MATVTVNTSKLLFPFDACNTYGYGSVGFAIAGSNGGVGLPYVPYETFTVTQVMFSYSVTTTPSPTSFDVGIQAFDATTGFPTGTFLTSAVWTCPTSGSGVATVNVTAFSMVAGTKYYLVIRNATAGYSGSVTIITGSRSNSGDKYYNASTRTSGVWSTGQLRPVGNFWFNSGTKYYGNCLYTVTGSASAITAPNELGMAITFPANGPNLILNKVNYYLTTINAGSTYGIAVRNTSGTLLASGTMDGDYVSTPPSVVLDTPVTMIAGTKYYILLQQISGTSPLIRSATQTSAQFMTDLRYGVVANQASYNGSTFVENTNITHIGYLEFSGIEYTQTGGASVYSIPASFSQIEG